MCPKPLISIPLTDDLTKILCEILGALDYPVSPAELHAILTQLSAPVFAPFRHTRPDAVEELLSTLADREVITRDTNQQFSYPHLPSATLRALFLQPTYANLATAIALARPFSASQSEKKRQLCLKRDFKNAFYALDTALLGNSLQIIQNLYDNFDNHEIWFDFLLDEPVEWFRQLPVQFLAVCGWHYFPAAIQALHPIHPLAEVLYDNILNMPAQVVCTLIDYAILCKDWEVIKGKLLQQLTKNSAPRTTRVACFRFLSGKDVEACGLFDEALDSLQRETDSHHAYFRSIGGIFFVLALLRSATPESLSAAAANAQLGFQENTPYKYLYRTLEQIAQSRAMPELSFEAPRWVTSTPLANCFACITQYWMTAELNEEQTRILEQNVTLATQGGYRWLAEECAELQKRLRHLDKKDPQTQRNYPFVIDCIPNENSWTERYARIARTMTDLPLRGTHRLAWQIKFDPTPTTSSVRPIEQHANKNGHWSRGRKFTAYQKLNFSSLLTNGADLDLGIDLTPQDKFACDCLRNFEDLQRKLQTIDSAEIRKAKTQLLQALVGHPHLYLDTPDNRTVVCVTATPHVHITESLGTLRYTIVPQPPTHGNLLPKLENGDVIAIYEFSEELRNLNRLLGDEFLVPAGAPENQAILNRLMQHFSLLADIRLPLDMPQNLTSPLPTIRLLPQDKGLKVEILVKPFPNGAFYAPGEGPVEMLARQRLRVLRYTRDLDAEKQAANFIVNECVWLKNAQTDTPWTWFLVDENSCYELTLKLHSLLDKCRIIWPEEHRFLCRKTIGMGNVSLRTQSYHSWFSVEGEVKLEDTDGTVSLGELIQVAIDHKRFVELSDGQVVELSETLRQRLLNLSRAGELSTTEAGLKLQICKFLMPFVSKDLNEFQINENTPEQIQWVQQFDDAMKMNPPTPDKLKANLRPYQRDGFVWLARLDKAHAGACLADDMGLGKTLQAISLLLACADEGPCLVVAPTSVCANWLAELQRFAPSLDSSVFGTGNRSQTFKHLKAGKVLITSYGLLQSENAAFKKIHWRVAILDEAQAIKNSHAKRSKAALEINADFRIVTTGTPVENNLTELWSIFNFILPGLLGSRESFQKRFALPIEHDENQEATKHLRSIVSPFLLRRRKDQVLSELPPKEDIDYPVELSPEEKEFYNRLRLSILQDLENHQENEGQKHIRVLAGITKLRLAVDHPSLVDGGANLPGSKLEAFMNLLKQVLDNGHKVLVFSQFVKFLSIVATTLDNAGITYEYLDGGQSPKERSAAVKNFQEGDVPVFLISLKAGGLGLNLTQADYVIHLDSWWNPAVENQASDRAHRLGQDKKVTIYHLQTSHTIEDKIKALHQRKRDLADQLLSESDTINTKSLEELLRLLREE